MLKGFVAVGQVSVYIFEPEMSTRDLPSGSERADADKLVACVQQEQALQISLEVEAASNASRAAVPDWYRAQSGNPFRKEFLKENYFTIVRRYAALWKTKTLAAKHLYFSSRGYGFD